MEECSASQPRKQRSVFHRVPAPIATPPEDGVSPVSAEKNAGGLKAPGNHGPFAREMNPLLAGITCQQRSQRKREGYGESRIAGIEIRRMNHHFRILQERSKAVAIGASNQIHSAMGARNGQRFERAGDKVVQREE